MKDAEQRARARQWQGEQARKILRMVQACEMDVVTLAEIDALFADLKDDARPQRSTASRRAEAELV